MNSPLKKRKTLVIAILISGIILLQFVQPHLENPPVSGRMAVPDKVRIVLQKACYDCHSNETNLRWYDRISPLSWKVAEDVQEGRRAVNFSEWSQLLTAQEQDKFWEIVNLAISGVMPLKEYALVHPSVKLSEADKEVLKDYVSTLAVTEGFDTVKNRELAAQFIRWQKGEGPSKVPVASNGVAYDPDYKNWQAISATDSYSNGTMRVIVGNAMAIRAIRENNTRIWPDGTVLAKIQWDKLVDESGNIHTGKFNQVEFMVKDAKKYSATAGWGWARFKTLDLVPDDKEALFETKCIHCHRPVKDLDYVFTFPIKQ